MSFSIETSMVEQFSANVHLLAEQRMSRLRNTVVDEELVGEAKAVERIGKPQDEPNTITTRHGDTPLDDTPHTRRWIYPADYDVADLIDRPDQLKLLIELEGPYTTRHAGVMGRGIDTEIIRALGGTAKEGKSGGTDAALPAAQKVGVSSTGLTIAKLIEAREKMEEDEVDDFLTKYLVCTPAQISDLLEDDKVSSSDFNTVRALVKGEIDEYMGFQFIRLSSRRLGVDGSSNRLVYAYSGAAIRFAIPKPPTTIVADRPDKRHSKQVYTCGSWGAVRVEDVHVVEIACAES